MLIMLEVDALFVVLRGLIFSALLVKYFFVLMVILENHVGIHFTPRKICRVSDFFACFFYHM